MDALVIDTSKPGYFTADALHEGAATFYRDNGFLVVHDAVSHEEVEEMRAETVAICRGTRGEVAVHQQQLSPEALKRLPDDDLIAHFLCVHQAHKISPVMSRQLAHPVIVDVLTRVIGPNVKCMQSMLFVKAAGKPGQHQDEAYIPTRDRSLAGGWIALDDATVENGCLWIIPGSHRSGVLWPQYPHADERFDCLHEAYDFPYVDEDAVPVEVPKGSIVFFNGYLLHRSLPNQGAGFRRALVNHYMSAESLLPWSYQEGVGMARLDMRDIVMIAGTDPYAYKGIDDTQHPAVRGAGEGGCGDGRMDFETFKRQSA